jgi:solute:Na+ symporter, SSS family
VSRPVFTPLDFLVVVLYLAGTTTLGVWLGRTHRTARDYFIADHTIPWWAVLISVVATETSAVTFISIPGVAYIGNFTFLQVAVGYIVGRIVVAFTLLPRYFQGDLVTAYALLERRFGLGTRRFASVVFMVTRALADSVRVFATAIPIALILQAAVAPQYVMPLAIVVLGALTIVYTYHGGMRAVIWTDVVQTAVYLLAAVAALVLLGRSVAGGWPAILGTAAAAGKLRVLDAGLVVSRPYTIWGGVIGGAFLAMASHGADQLIVQRLLAASSLRDARRALIGSGLVVAAQFTLFLFIGIGLYAYYQAGSFARPDDIFPTFILHRMPAGFVGLIVAAILATTMSTHSGAINSLAASTTHDLYLPLARRRADDPAVFRMGRLFTLMWGVVLTGGALLFRQQGTPVVVVALSIASASYGGLLGGFFLAMWWRRAEQRDAIIGMAVGLAVMLVVVFPRQIGAVVPPLVPVLAPLAAITWPWYVLIGTTITLVTGVAASLTHPAPAGPASAPAAGRAGA